jgi:hypothetical protein
MYTSSIEQKNKPTAGFWRGPTASNKRSPLIERLSLGWRLAQHDAKLLYHYIGQFGHQNEPHEIDKQSMFEHVLEGKSYSQLGDFFGEYFLKNFEQ